MSRERGAQAGGGPVWIARLVWGLVLAGFVIHFVPGLGLVTGYSVIAGGPSKLFVIIAFALFVLSFATVGALVASRLAGNPIGWLQVWRRDWWSPALAALPGIWWPLTWPGSRCMTRGRCWVS